MKTVSLVVGLSVLTIVLGLTKEDSLAQKNMPQFRALSREDSARLDAQRALVAATAKAKYGTTSLTKTKADLPVLQRLIDEEVFEKTQTYELQCLGVAFGDVLASEFPLKWMMVTDKYGTDPTLKYKTTTIQINALTMISKRIERDERVNLDYLLRTTGEQLAHYERAWAK